MQHGTHTHGLSDKNLDKNDKKYDQEGNITKTKTR